MGIRDWFSRRPPKAGPAQVGSSPGGSRLLKYGGDEFERPTFGFPDEDVSPLAEEREKQYDALFGKCDNVFHELIPIVPHIDVYSYPPFGQRDFTTYVTGGMSDLPQHSPPELGADVRRVELVFYASPADEKYCEFLRRLAHFPHDNQTWLHWGHTMPNGTPPEPLFDDGPLDAIMLMPSILQPDADLGQRLSWHGEPINLLWVVPMAMAECEYKLQHGSDAIYELFNRVRHPHVFSGNRRSYV